MVRTVATRPTRVEPVAFRTSKGSCAPRGLAAVVGMGEPEGGPRAVSAAAAEASGAASEAVEMVASSAAPLEAPAAVVAAKGSVVVVGDAATVAVEVAVAGQTANGVKKAAAGAVVDDAARR